MEPRTQEEIDHWACQDCGKDCLETAERDYYMITNKLWKKHGVGRELLCMDCIEERIGHKLTRDDITDCPVNTSLNTYLKPLFV